MEACRNSIVVRVLRSRGDMHPVCAEPTKPLPGGVHYSAPVDCGAMNAEHHTRCNSVSTPCLFDIFSDPCEYNDIANGMPEVVYRLLARLQHYEETAVPPGNQEADELANPELQNHAWVPWHDE
ncbi:hypothetical protein HPB52_017330 [Rhipicephalus sanguineus]|uniref:Uncharacterized protein n=1 Tax=Rhipicephalus sanguineus TaxID=34632 RepID=A0A9D4T0X0_RHISA|nr:hypothetical protein HPB52_017330 [Rhipicephalus sanguineus]